ncbi:hypothetical protein EON64_02025 [archaeon]|nr:MAG: hypothetical protein EON64_02025 [archaeon]
MLDKNSLGVLNSLCRLFIATSKKAQLPIELSHILLSGNLFKKVNKLSEGDNEEDRHFYLVKLLMTLMVHADVDVAKRLLDSPNIDSIQSLLADFSDETYSIFLSGILYLFLHGARLAEELSQKFYSLSSTKNLLAVAASSSVKYDLCISYLESIALACKSGSKQEMGMNLYHRRTYVKTLVTSLEPLVHPARAKVGLEIASINYAL